MNIIQKNSKIQWFRRKSKDTDSEITYTAVRNIVI